MNVNIWAWISHRMHSLCDIFGLFLFMPCLSERRNMTDLVLVWVKERNAKLYGQSYCYPMSQKTEQYSFRQLQMSSDFQNSFTIGLVSKLAGTNLVIKESHCISDVLLHYLVKTSCSKNNLINKCSDQKRIFFGSVLFCTS